jgi:hypothetical protein
MTTTDKAEMIRVGDVIMPPAAELNGWMRRHVAQYNLPETALHLHVTEVYEGAPDKRGRWIGINTHYDESWGGKLQSFNFKARPATPWAIVERAKTHWEPLLGEVTDAECEKAFDAYYGKEVAQ